MASCLGKGRFIVKRFVTILLFAFCATGADAQTDHLIPGTAYHLSDGAVTDPELVTEVEAADARLFRAIFDACDIDAASTMLTEDVRFIHDKWGQTANDRATLVNAFKSGCKNQAAGSDFHSRREIVPGTQQVHALNGYGAIETGKHRFYAVLPGKPEQLTEISEFVILWKHVGGKWLMAEAISYDHKLTDEK
jgi:hypothetical protein